MNDKNDTDVSELVHDDTPPEPRNVYVDCSVPECKSTTGERIQPGATNIRDAKQRALEYGFVITDDETLCPACFIKKHRGEDPYPKKEKEGE